MQVILDFINSLFGVYRFCGRCPVCQEQICVEIHRKVYLTECSLCESFLEICPNATVHGWVPVEWLHDAQNMLHQAERGHRFEDLERKLSDAMRMIKVQQEVIKRGELNV